MPNRPTAFVAACTTIKPIQPDKSLLSNQNPPSETMSSYIALTSAGVVCKNCAMCQIEKWPANLFTYPDLPLVRSTRCSSAGVMAPLLATLFWHGQGVSSGIHHTLCLFPLVIRSAGIFFLAIHRLTLLWLVPHFFAACVIVIYQYQPFLDAHNFSFLLDRVFQPCRRSLHLQTRLVLLLCRFATSHQLHP